MAPLSIENLDFSFWIEPEKKTAYLQEWEEGNWGHPETYAIPQSLDELPKHSRLARALKSFRRDPAYATLRSTLEAGLVREPVPDRSLWTFLQACSARLVALIYA